MAEVQAEPVIRSARAVLAGLIVAAAVVVLTFGGFLISTGDSGPTQGPLPAPIVIIPEGASTAVPKSPTPEPTPTPAPIPPPAPIPEPPPAPDPGGEGEVPPPPADDEDGGDDGGGDGGDDGGDDGGGGGDDDDG